MKYSPHKYQTYATDFILEHPVSAVFLDMGLGKSVITLTAIFGLCLDSFLVRKVLVIAPLRVAADTWPCEIEKWDHLRGLTYSVAVGSEAQRKAALLQTPSCLPGFSITVPPSWGLPRRKPCSCPLACCWICGSATSSSSVWRSPSGS